MKIAWRPLPFDVNVLGTAERCSIAAADHVHGDVVYPCEVFVEHDQLIARLGPTDVIALRWHGSGAFIGQDETFIRTWLLKRIDTLLSIMTAEMQAAQPKKPAASWKAQLDSQSPDAPIEERSELAELAGHPSIPSVQRRIRQWMTQLGPSFGPESWTTFDCLDGRKVFVCGGRMGHYQHPTIEFRDADTYKIAGCTQAGRDGLLTFDFVNADALYRASLMMDELGVDPDPGELAIEQRSP